MAETYTEKTKKMALAPSYLELDTASAYLDGRYRARRVAAETRRREAARKMGEITARVFGECVGKMIRDGVPVDAMRRIVDREIRKFEAEWPTIAEAFGVRATITEESEAVFAQLDAMTGRAA